jgi:hypothetical protein
MRTAIPLLLLVILAFQSCEPSSTNPVMREALVPVYGSPQSAKLISAESPRPTVNSGKIYTVGSLLYQVEQDSGIHVINYSNPSSPQKIGFIRSFLCKELSVKNGLIYTNNLADLVVIDASNLNAVREVGRTANVFPDLAVQYPAKPQNSSMIYFECADPSRGVVFAWERRQTSNANCRR